MTLWPFTSNMIVHNLFDLLGHLFPHPYHRNQNSNVVELLILIYIIPFLLKNFRPTERLKHNELNICISCIL